MKDPDYGKYMNTQQAINLGLMRAFAKESIGFAYPTRSLFVEAPVKVEIAQPQAS
jgi:small-conductance mechanosensitive channel